MRLILCLFFAIHAVMIPAHVAAHNFQSAQHENGATIDPLGADCDLCFASHSAATGISSYTHDIFHQQLTTIIQNDGRDFGTSSIPRPNARAPPSLLL